MAVRRLLPLALALLLAAPASAQATSTPINWLTGEAQHGKTLSCTNNGHAATFKYSGITHKGLVGTFEAQGSATFGQADKYGFAPVTSLHILFTVKGRAGQIANGELDGGGPQYDSGIGGACGQDEDFGFITSINGVQNVHWTGDVKSRFGTYHDKGTGNVNDLDIYSDGTASGDAALNISSVPTGKPVNVFRPAITGAPKVGSTLSCYGGDWIGAFAVSRWEWLRDGAPVVTHYGEEGKVGDPYTVQPADAAHRLTCRTTADRGFNQDAVSALSNAALVGGCLVPNLRGRSLADAKAALAKGGCALGAVTRKKHKGVPVGHVLSQQPAAGATGPRGLKVAVVLRKKPG